MIDNIATIKKYIQQAEAILITAGAGMGVDSGLPDFRGDKGFWKAYPVIAKLGLSFSDMANPHWFENDPKLAWAFYGHRLNLYRETTPHDGFKILLELVKQKKENYFIFTSNVDGQFQKAGFDDKKIVEVHGSIHHTQCSKNCDFVISDAKDLKVEVDMEKFEALNIPLCPNCSAVLRPNILMFGDAWWNETREFEQKQRYLRWLKENRDKKMAIIEIGAGTAIPTVRIQSEKVALQTKDAKLIRINPRDFEVPKGLGFSVALGGLEGLKDIIPPKSI